MGCGHAAEINTIEELYNISDRPLLIFAGSGISVPDPTGLPTSLEAVKSLLRLDWVHGDEKFPLTEKQVVESKLKDLRFEHVLSSFNEWNGHDIGALMQQLADVPPNWYHHRIAGLCREKKVKCIITTNFDRCLEKALKENGVRYNVIVKDTDRFSEDGDVINLFKIHGSVEKSGATYIAVDICATLEAISVGLAGWKEELLKKLLAKYLFVFIGYSGMDTYDINPVLYLSNGRHICWISHGSKPASRDQPDLQDKPVSQEVDRILSGAAFGKCLNIDTATFLGGTPLRRRETEFHFKESYDIKKMGHPSCFVGRTIESTEDYAMAKDYYSNVVFKMDEAKYEANDNLNLFRSFGVSFYELGEFDQAKMWLNMALLTLLKYRKASENNLLFKVTHTRSWRDLVFFNQLLLLNEELALTSAAKGEKVEALGHIEKAFQCICAVERRPDDRKVIESRLLLNRASIYRMVSGDGGNGGHAILAIEDLKRAMEIKKEIGDATGLIKSCYMLGSFYLELGDLSRSEDMFLDVYDMIRKLKSPTPPRIFEQPSFFLAILLYWRFKDQDETAISGFLKNKDSLDVEKFRERINELLTRYVQTDKKETIKMLMTDQAIKDCCSQMEVKAHVSDE